jgi:hypothetical protein
MRRVAGGFDGSYSLRLDALSGGTGSFGVTDQPDWVGSTPAAGTRYRFIAWLRSTASRGRVQLLVRETLGKKNRPWVKSAVVTLSPSWEFVTLDYVAYWAGSSLDVQIVDQPVAARETFQVDAITIIANPVASPSVAPAAPSGAAPIAAAPDGSSTLATPTPAVGLVPRVTPNPVRTSAQLAFRLERPTRVRIQVFDLGGRLVRTLPVGNQTSAGWNVVDLEGRTFHGAPLRSGVYLYEISAGAQHAVGRFVVMR